MPDGTHRGGGGGHLELWVIYDHPRDFPSCYVARLWLDEQPTVIMLVASQLDLLRRYLEQRGKYRMPRAEQDDPSILEVWI